MILELANRMATFVAYDGTKFTVPYKIDKVDVPPRMGVKLTGLFDWRTMITEGRIIKSTTADEATAALRMVEQWPLCEEKPRYIRIIKTYLTNDRERRRENYISGMKELYGEVRGTTLFDAIHNNELPRVPAYYLREDGVAKLINFLIDEVPGLSSYSNPLPNSNLTAMRACQFFVFSRNKASKLKEKLAGVDSDDKIKASFRVAKFYEDRT